MKILLTNDLSQALMSQEKEKRVTFLSSIKGLSDLTKTQIMALDTVVKIPTSKEQTQLFAYNVVAKDYAIFTFAKRNELLIVDYVELHNNGVTSLAFPDASADKGK